MRKLTEAEQAQVQDLLDRYKPIAFDDSRLSREENDLVQAHLNGGWDDYLTFELAFCRGEIGSDQFVVDENGIAIDPRNRG